MESVVTMGKTTAIQQNKTTKLGFLILYNY
jgi:hypothetical protein